MVKNRIKIHHDIWKRLRPYTINLIVDFSRLSLTVFAFWLLGEQINTLFSDIPISIIILLRISEIATVIYYIKVIKSDLCT